MTQYTSQIGADQSGLAYRNADNAGKQAILNHHKGAAAPSYAEAGMIWLDDSATPWTLKVYDGADWITLGEINATDNSFQPYNGASAPRVLNFAADTGAANAYAVAPAPAATGYAAGQVVTLKPANPNTGAATLNVNALGAVGIKLLDGADPAANALLATGVYTLVYDGAAFIVLNPSLPAFTGDSGTGGAQGLVPAPSAGDAAAGKVLGAGGGWVDSGAASVRKNAQSGAYTLLAGDRSALLDFTGSANATFSFTAAATLGDGWFCFIRNNGAAEAELTLDPSGAELIDGLSAFIMYPGEERLVQCDGTAFTSIILKGFLRRYTASGTFTAPPGYQAFDCELWGGGGGGGAVGGSGGGGGGAYNRITVEAAVMGASQTITVGSGGAVSTAGGESSVGALSHAYGGGSASSQDAGGGGGGGGQISAGQNASGTTHGAGGGPNGTSNTGASNVDGMMGGGGGGTKGGSSIYGGGGGTGGGSGAVYAGMSFYGGGGGGSTYGTRGVSFSGGNGGADTVAGAVPGGGGGRAAAGGSGQVNIRGVV